ncbi:MAG TPA: CocE/NonD family hydrolase, partial [Burkholderiaceae bacterium]|nr:CocE/NonD family hydrolase [Burkholderiaceae bacterium]
MQSSAIRTLLRCISHFSLLKRDAVIPRKTKTFTLALFGLSILAGDVLATPVMVDADMNEQVVMVPAVSGSESILLETTIFKPSGPGPFPVLLMNHGKSLGNPRTQKRDRFIAVSREFVKRGYAVVIPMRKGFAQSTGDYREKVCDMTGNGQMQADDLRSALNYIAGQSWADKNRLLVGGQSYGGLATMAFGTRGFPGVRALINFAGGLRIHGSLCHWSDSLVQAFAEFGKHTMVPSIWFYGENDRHFKPELVTRMYGAYVQAGGKAKLVAYGPFKNDAHGMSSSWDGVRIWWPETEKLLKEVGLPTDEVVVIDDDPRTQKTDYAVIDNVDAVPYLK